MPNLLVTSITSRYAHLSMCISCWPEGQSVTDLRAGAAQDIGTLDSGLNSMVLASNNEMVLLPVNEPTFGTKRKSQIQVRAWGGCTARHWSGVPF